MILTMIIGLKPTEKKILIAISKIGKPIADISRHTGIPRTSILYMLKKLQALGLIKPVIIGKRKFWKHKQKLDL